MATIQGLTAPRMLEIEAAAIVAGVVDENMNLILTKHDGSTINAGKVQGDGVPTGGTEGQIIIHTVDGSIWADNFATNVEQVIKNSTGATLSKGTAVYVSGASGDNVLVSKAQANAEATSSKTLGLLHNDVANGATGQVITEGTLYGFDTSAATVGDAVWLSPSTAGGLVYGLANKPTVPNHMVYLGVVIRSHAVNGAIYVKVQNGYELDELHDVKITNPQPKQVIKRDPTNQFWLNEAASGGVVVSGTNPVDPSVGDGWFYDANGDLFVRYFDGTNYAWMQPSVPMSPTIEQRYYSPNYVINGGFEIWQRGTSATMNGLNTYKTADRWGAYRNNGNATESRQAAGLTGFSYCGRYQRNASNAASDIIWAVQSIETSNSVIFAGKSATLSFYARAGANFSSASSALKVQVVSGTGTDQNVLSGFTGEAFPVDQTVTLTTSWQRFTVTATVGSTVTQLGVRFNYTPSGTAGAADYFEITGVQLEEGSAATTFRRNANSLQGELAACQRYYYQTAGGAGDEIGTGSFWTTNLFFAQVTWPVTMRTRPSISTNNVNGFASYSGGVVRSSSGFSVNNTSPNIAMVSIVTPNTGTTGYSGWLETAVSNAVITASAEI